MKNKCRDCEFCFPHEEFGYVCAGDNYGENIYDSLDDNKPCYSEGLDAFIERAKQEEIIYIPNTKLGQLKIDGRKQIELTDVEGKTIRIKASRAKEIFGEVVHFKNYIRAKICLKRISFIKNKNKKRTSIHRNSINEGLKF